MHVVYCHSDYVSFFFCFVVDTKFTNMAACELVHKWLHMHARVNSGSKGAQMSCTLSCGLY